VKDKFVKSELTAGELIATACVASTFALLLQIG
jgi:hypothetical protein